LSAYRIKTLCHIFSYVWYVSLWDIMYVCIDLLKASCCIESKGNYYLQRNYVFLRRRRQNIRRNRVFRDRDNPMDYTDDADIISKYMLSRPLILNLCQMFQNDLQRPTMRSHAFSVSLQIIVALRFYNGRESIYLLIMSASSV
jgi:hypothetical protein